MAKIAEYLPENAERRTTAFPALDKDGQGRFYLAFDAATDEECFWTGVMPAFTGALTLRLLVRMASAVVNEVIFRAALEAITPGDAVDTDAASSFDTDNVSSATTVPGTAGNIFLVTITLTNNDGIAQGDYYRIRVGRDADNAGDDATGDAHLLAAELRDAA